MLSVQMRPGRVGFVKSRLPGPVSTVGQPEQQRSPKQTFPAKRRHALPLARSHFRGMNSQRSLNEPNFPRFRRRTGVQGHRSGRRGPWMCQTAAGPLNRTRILPKGANTHKKKKRCRRSSFCKIVVKSSSAMEKQPLVNSSLPATDTFTNL